MADELSDIRGVRVAVEGCVSKVTSDLKSVVNEIQGHGTLNAIYASVAESCKARGWDSVDLVIIGGDFQASVLWSVSNW
jgi:lariat debranching enzyme